MPLADSRFVALSTASLQRAVTSIRFPSLWSPKLRALSPIHPDSVHHVASLFDLVAGFCLPSCRRCQRCSWIPLLMLLTVTTKLPDCVTHAVEPETQAQRQWLPSPEVLPM